MQSQWIQLPALPVSGSAYSVAFINKDTGYVSMDTPALLRTTNGGQSWVVVGNYRIYTLQFVDSMYGYGNGRRSLNDMIYKTTDGGFTWDSLLISSLAYDDIFFVNRDTGWVSGYDGFNIRMWKTTNGGISLVSQYSSPGSGQFKNVFFLRNKVNNEYYGWWVADPSLLRTTNSGMNWNIIYMGGGQCGGIVDFYFKDTSNGVMTRGNRCFQTTTNGGGAWLIKNEFNVLTNSRIGMANANTGWITLSSDSIIKTNNFFSTFGKQVLPQNASIGSIFVIDTNNVYSTRFDFVKTTNGGGNFVSVTQISSEVPEQFSLSQNYPNPFNPVTSIEFSIPQNSNVSLIIYDVLGRETYTELSNKNLKAGAYNIKLDFNKANISSGVYFYKLTAINNTGIFTLTKKMIYVK